MPVVDRGLKPETSTRSLIPPIPSRSVKPQTSLYTSTGLRTVRVPTMLMTKFLLLAESNTTSNIETCGILAGNLSNNCFNITHLLIPKQKGFSFSWCIEKEVWKSNVLWGNFWSVLREYLFSSILLVLKYSSSPWSVWWQNELAPSFCFKELPTLATPSAKKLFSSIKTRTISSPLDG